jgi:outer membrane beta-barrel protein
MDNLREHTVRSGLPMGPRKSKGAGWERKKARSDFLNRLLLALFVLTAGSAWAQNELEGLDLTDNPKKEEKKPEEKPAAKPPPSSSSSTSSSTAAPAKKPADTGDLGAVERDITQEDRVKSVQKKLYVKRRRVELAPYFTFQLNDPYYFRLGAAVRLAFYLADTIAISLRGTYLSTIPTEDVRVAKRVFDSRVFFSRPFGMVMADLEWSPFYGKVAFSNSILQLDGFLVLGAGGVYTETSPTEGIHPAFDIGGGLRFIVRDWVAVNAALINTTYVEAPAGTVKNIVQNAMMLHVGLSIFIPFRSTFQEAQ